LRDRKPARKAFSREQRSSQTVGPIGISIDVDYMLCDAWDLVAVVGSQKRK